MPADEFLRIEARVLGSDGTIQSREKKEKKKKHDSENPPSLSLIQKYVWAWLYVKHLYKYRLCPFIHIVWSCLWEESLSTHYENIS